MAKQQQGGRNQQGGTLDSGSKAPRQGPGGSQLGLSTQDAAQVKKAGRERNTLGQTESQTAYWQDQYQSEPYYNRGSSFSDYEPAYRTGIEGRAQYPGQRFEEVEDDLRSHYENSRGTSQLGWNQGASQACRAAWDHADRMSDSDRDRQTQR